MSAAIKIVDAIRARLGLRLGSADAAQITPSSKPADAAPVTPSSTASNIELNPNAKAFSFNPGAAVFSPGTM